MRHLVLAVLASTGCAEPVITMALKLPPSTQTANIDVSCVGSIDVVARGADRGAPPNGPNDPGRPADDVPFCLDVDGLASFDAIRDALHDKVALTLPASGLAGIEVIGNTATCKHDAPSAPIFYGGATYTTDDMLVTVPVNPSVSCATSMMKVRPVDLFALTASPTHQCPDAIPESPQTGVDTYVLRTTLLDGPLLNYSGTTAPIKAGVGTIPGYEQVGASNACLAFAFGNGAALTAASCVHQGPSVCAQPGEIELPVVDGFAAGNLVGKSPIKAFRGTVIGGVWGSDAFGKAPLVGATVEIDPKKGTVVYAAFTADPTVTLDLNATATTQSGLFVVYTNEFVDVTVSAPGFTSEKVRVAPNGGSDSTVLVALRRQSSAP